MLFSGWDSKSIAAEAAPTGEANTPMLQWQSPLCKKVSGKPLNTASASDFVGATSVAMLFSGLSSKSIAAEAAPTGKANTPACNGNHSGAQEYASRSRPVQPLRATLWERLQSRCFFLDAATKSIAAEAAPTFPAHS
ncbi:MAG: hypothetical protein M3Y93_11885 [Pseudomonadota bacterium]|nr:hypothetical protein [Pseudomonadota bacterium]